MVVIDIGKILSIGSLVLGIIIAVAGLLSALNVFKAAFNLAYLTYSMSTILFGVLIAQTYSPIPALVKWFPFVMPFTGRGCFMIYVGLGLFYGEFDFIDLVGLFTIIFGIVFLALSCTGKVKDPEEQGGVKATGTANRV